MMRLHPGDHLDRRRPAGADGWATTATSRSRSATAVAQVLAFAAATFEDFRYVDELAGGDRVALIFRARVRDRELQGLDLVHTDAEGRIDELTVMVRPMSGLVARLPAKRPFEREDLRPSGLAALGEAMAAKVVAAGLKD